MSVIKTPQGRWKAVVKVGRAYSCSKTFDREKDAKAWEAAERAKRSGIVDPKAAHRLVIDVVPDYLKERKLGVAESTYRNERWVFDGTLRKYCEWLLHRSVGSIAPRDIERVYLSLREHGRSHGTILKVRTTLSSFFDWTQRAGMRADNPVKDAVVPRRTEPEPEMKPYSLQELNEHYAAWHELSPNDAEIARFLGLTALRWGEARALTVGDVDLQGAYPSVLVRCSRPEGVKVGATKGHKTRHVPLADVFVPFIKGRIEGRADDEPLMPPMSRSRFRKRLDWVHTSGKRRTHDLRHTAITLWLASGIDVQTAKNWGWGGYGSLQMLSRYSHWISESVDQASVNRLNRVLNPRGNSGDIISQGKE
ncbi:MAG: tyrosine-type recombinase/integrase [Bifidobacterium tibiigranuli]|jgi:integrase|uniref:tyrosine-type recombinase/integrase n=1 Tax=Bifidobacterium tibiigranuli TaxID=2172043 RepID=UPI0026EE724B|nr:tyrosine-type recombinase/integrase [Bifidobacterium tibiigranuli]MCI1672628.1 tyrosine-type recombinase/integrase [Bifidobacterium tibiigranuli]MCI1712367.1 tyrosine-type recombinase/integrase [Bifidobacterium tibiigranuli]